MAGKPGSSDVAWFTTCHIPGHMVMIMIMTSHTYFAHSPLSPSIQEELLATAVWKPDCPVPLERLRILTLAYKDFDNIPHTDGQMIVLDAVAPYVLTIFQELYRRDFPIASLRRIEAYGGDDERSMADNNSSAFNFREITGGGALPSIHSYGLAIDINPVQNPYIAPDPLTLLPPEGRAYINRRNLRAGMVEPVVDVFCRHGFTVWGGNWNDPVDWQHFQPPRSVALLLVALRAPDAERLFTLFTRFPDMLSSLSWQDDIPRWIALYRDNPDRFMHALGENAEAMNGMAGEEAFGLMERSI
jgi:hypothetical protein